MSKKETYKDIREITGFAKDTVFFTRDEMETILTMTGHLHKGTHSPYKTTILFEKYIKEWIPQATTDAHPVELNLNLILKLLSRKNVVLDFIKSLKDTDISRVIKEISVTENNTITIKLKGGK